MRQFKNAYFCTIKLAAFLLKRSANNKTEEK